MLNSSPLGLDEIMATASASPAAYLMLEMKAPSRDSVTSRDSATPPSDREKSEDLDGCDVEIAEATLDEDLPASEGGVA